MAERINWSKKVVLKALPNISVKLLHTFTNGNYLCLNVKGDGIENIFKTDSYGAPVNIMQDYTIMNVPEFIPQSGWVNVYRLDDGGYCVGAIWDTKREAVENSSDEDDDIADDKKAEDTIQITWKKKV